MKNKFDIIYEDESILAINKPAGMLSIPNRDQSEKSLKEFLQEKYESIFTVHRLDKDTSGILLFAKNEYSHKYLSQLFEERQIEKYYAGIVLGQPQTQKGSIEAPIAAHPTQKGLMMVHRNGKPSHTDYEVLQSSKFYSLLKFHLHTGRTHQIRVHCKNIGHPLACDPLYGDGKSVLLSSFKKNYKLSKNEWEEKPVINRLALHSFQLLFVDEGGISRNLIAPMPKEFTALMNQISKVTTT